MRNVFLWDSRHYILDQVAVGLLGLTDCSVGFKEDQMRDGGWILINVVPLLERYDKHKLYDHG